MDKSWFIYMALVLLGGVAVVTWLTWIPVKQLASVEWQVAEFNRQVREWESANPDDR